MSLLESIKSKKQLLKKTETTVTQPDGKIYKESKDGHSSCIGVSSGFVVDTKPDKIPAKIIDNLYLGSQDCCDSQTLSEYHIKTVLSVGIEAPIKYDNVSYKFVDCLDLPETNLKKFLQQSITFMDSCINNNCNILVHCNAGVSRSASVVIGFLILKKGYTFSEALAICKDARSCVKPNAGFERQLKLLKDGGDSL